MQKFCEQKNILFLDWLKLLWNEYYWSETLNSNLILKIGLRNV